MSMTKRNLFDPELAEERRQAIETIQALRTLPLGPLWENALYAAATELKVKTITVNARLCFKHEADRDRVSERAEVLWCERHAHYAAGSPR